jgi:hypothetical protein
MLRIYCFFLVAFLAFCLFVTETVYAQDEQEVNNDSIELVRARVIESKEEEGYNFLLTLEIKTPELKYALVMKCWCNWQKTEKISRHMYQNMFVTRSCYT